MMKMVFYRIDRLVDVGALFIVHLNTRATDTCSLYSLWLPVQRH